jgi:signal peptidase I
VSDIKESEGAAVGEPEEPSRSADSAAAAEPAGEPSDEAAKPADSAAADSADADSDETDSGETDSGETDSGETDSDEAGAAKPGKAERSPGAALYSLVREVVLVLVIALGLSLLIKTFLVQAFFIPSPSMESTLLVGDRVLVSKLTPGPFDLKRGDVVVFSDPDHWLTPTERESEGTIRDGIRSGLTFVGLLPADSDEHLIKRLIGLPGDKVVCCDDQDRLTVNGTAIDEPYIYGDDMPSEKKFSITVPPGRIWVMGDHRSVSQDSRFHQEQEGGGAVPISNVVGRAFVKVWPLDRFGLLRNPSSVFDKVPSP